MEVVNVILKFAFLFILFGGCVFIAMGIVYLKKKIAEVKNVAGEDVALQSAFELANAVLKETTATTVAKLEQIFGKDLKIAVKKGDALESDLWVLADVAFEEILRMLQPNTINSLNDVLGDTSLYIKNMVESEVLRLKQQK